MIKLELLDQKHGLWCTRSITLSLLKSLAFECCNFAVQDIGSQLSTFVRLMLTTYDNCRTIIEPTKGLFPIEVDLVRVPATFFPLYFLLIL